MNRCTFNVKKGIIVAWILLLSVWWAHAQNVGDLRTNRSPARTGTVGDWQIRTGPGSDDWATATGNITALLAAAGKITMNHAILADLSCVVNGEIVNPNSSTMTVATTAVFTLGPSPNGKFSNYSLVVNPGGRFINNGTMTSATHNKGDITLEDSTTSQPGGIFENQGSLTMNGKIDLGEGSKLIVGAAGTIGGSGRIHKDKGAGSEIQIANPIGFEAINLNCQNCNDNVSVVFNGDGDQVTGTVPPAVAHVTVADGTNLTLTNSVNLNTFTVKNGATLKTNNKVISGGYGSQFTLEEGATIVISNADGISSFPEGPGNIINTGAVQMDNASYSSKANYVFNGTGPGGRQNSGNFITYPDENTVNSITNLSDGMLNLGNRFRPLNVTGTYSGNLNTDPDIPEGYINDDSPSLPVTMSYFNAFFNGFDSVVLQWETQTETNNLGFYVLRSTEPDATKASKISALVPAVNSSQGAAYCYEDNSLDDDGIYYYWLQDVSFSGAIELHGPTMAQVTLLAGSSQTPDIPLKTGLVRNFPNPFNPSTQLEYYLEKGSDVGFKVYNLKGQLVDQFTLRNQASGLHRYTWEPQLGSGTYLIKFSAEGKSNARKVILTK